MLPFFLAIAFRVFSRLLGIVAVGSRQAAAVGCVNTEYNFVPILSRNIVQALRHSNLPGDQTRLGHDKGDAPRGGESPFRMTTGAYSA